MAHSTQLHEDLISHLRSKIKNNVVDYVDIAKTMEVPSNDIIAGAGEALLTITVSFCHTSMNMPAHDFAALCFKLYTHFDEQEKRNAKQSK